MSVSPKAWKLKKKKKSGNADESSWTPAASLILALGEALKYLRKIGIANLIENTRFLARATSKEPGLEVFAERPGSSVTAVKAPAGMDSKVIVKGFKEQFGAVIANGQGTMQGRIFRIARIGYFDFADMFGMVAGPELIPCGNGHKVELGKGVAAVQRVYETAKAQPKTACA